MAVLIAGILILISPRLLNFIVAIYLIIMGVLGVWCADAAIVGSVAKKRGKGYAFPGQQKEVHR